MTKYALRIFVIVWDRIECTKALYIICLQVIFLYSCNEWLLTNEKNGLYFSKDLIRPILDHWSDIWNRLNIDVRSDSRIVDVGRERWSYFVFLS